MPLAPTTQPGRGLVPAASNRPPRIDLTNAAPSDLRAIAGALDGQLARVLDLAERAQKVAADALAENERLRGVIAGHLAAANAGKAAR